MTQLASMYISGQHSNFIEADHELDDIEIEFYLMPSIKAAYTAFVDDTQFLIDMMEAATLISYKKALWAARSEVARQERRARAKCETDNSGCPSFLCTNEAACGFGNCIYATAEYAAIKPSSSETRSPKTRVRPQASTHPFYEVDDTINALLCSRNIAPPRRQTRPPSRSLR